MKLKDKIIKNRVGILVIIGVLLVVTIIIGISYAYFFNIEIKNNNTISGNINTNSYIFSTYGDNNLSLTLKQDKLDIANASNNYTYSVGSSGYMSVELDAHGLKKVYCSYDLIYVPNEVYTPSIGALNAGLKEFTLSGETDSGNYFDEIDISGSDPVTLISNAWISTDEYAWDDWSFYTRYYNLDVVQDNVIGKTFSGNIKVVNANCSFNEPTLEIEKLLIANNTDRFDENGIRYEGANPKNYICLDNKTSGTCADNSLLFRIIGLFDEEYSIDGTTSNGSKKLLKIIDTNNYGGTDGKAWSSSEANNWDVASLKNELNEPYLTTLLGTSNVNSRLGDALVNTKWHLGGPSESNFKALTTEEIYTEERNPNAVYSGNSSSTYAPVGLMYPSDYAYATNTQNCRKLELGAWYDYSDCKNNDWLFTSIDFVNDAEWLISPLSSDSVGATMIYGGGNLSIKATSAQFMVRPTFYLDPSIIKIVGTGDGTKYNAYRIG